MMLFYILSLLYVSNAVPLEHVNKISNVNVMMNTTNLITTAVINLKQVTCDGTNTIKLDNPIDYDKAFEISFKFKSNTEHYGGMVSMRMGMRIIWFVVRLKPGYSPGFGFHFGAWMGDGTDILTTNSFGQPNFKAVNIVVGQEYTVKVLHDEAGNVNIFFDGTLFASGNMNFGTFDAVYICRGIGGGAGNFDGTITNLHIGSIGSSVVLPVTSPTPAVNLKQVTCDGTNPIKLDNIIDYDEAFEISFKFNSNTEHYGGMVSMRESGTNRIITFVVRLVSPPTGFHFGAVLGDGTDILTTNSFGQPNFKVVPIVVGQEYTVEVLHDDAGNVNIFLDGTAFASGDMNFGTFDALWLCRGFGGGAGNFDGTITNLHIGNIE